MHGPGHQVIRSGTREAGVGHHPYLGVDAGGTRTRAVVADQTGRRSRAEAGPANWTTLGPERCAAAIGEAVRLALEDCGLRSSELAGACIALAGYYPPWHHVEVQAALSRLLPGVRLRVEPDLVAAWAGATGGQPGIVLVAGTGSVAYGRDGGGRTARAGGWGPLFGDEGSGYWIGCEALRAVARCLDGRGPRTALARSGEELRAVYRDQWSRERVAGLSVGVAQAAAQGDDIALGILERAAAELGALVVAVAQQLEWTTEPQKLVGVGGVIEGRTAIRAAVERWLAEALPNLIWAPPAGSPVDGALLLAQSEGEW